MVKITLTILLLGIPTAAQYPKFLGEGDGTAMLVTPRHRITVWTGGFEQPHTKWAKRKTMNLCMRNDLPEGECLAAQAYVQRLTGFDGPSVLAEEIDAAADHVMDVWTHCGGSYASYAQRFDWSKITITVRDTIFPNPDTGVISGGITTNGGRTIWVVNLFFDGWFCCRKSAGLATMGAYARWELGNAIRWAYRGKPEDAGDIPPCQK